MSQHVEMSAPLRKPKTNNESFLDSVRERYTYNLGDGNYLVLEEVDASQGNRKSSNSLYVRGRGASNDRSQLQIEDLQTRRTDVSPLRKSTFETLATPAIKSRSHLRNRSINERGSNIKSSCRATEERSVRFATQDLHTVDPVSAMKPMP